MRLQACALSFGLLLDADGGIAEGAVSSSK